MTIEHFNTLSCQQKAELIFDANKITEKADVEANYQLFQINNFFIEVKASLDGKFKRSFKSFTLKNLPVEYAGEVLSIPIVILNKELKADEKISKQRDFVRWKAR